MSGKTRKFQLLYKIAAKVFSIRAVYTLLGENSEHEKNYYNLSRNLPIVALMLLLEGSLIGNCAEEFTSAPWFFRKPNEKTHRLPKTFHWTTQKTQHN